MLAFSFVHISIVIEATVKPFAFKVDHIGEMHDEEQKLTLKSSKKLNILQNKP